MSGLRTILSNIQNELKVPKNLYNSFGDYKYRNAESIYEAVKPLLAKYGCTLTLADELVEMGGRVYIKAVACLMLNVSTEVIYTTAFAKEAIDKKKMDDSQMTGTASSYARKYALNGLFLLDDTKDADSNEFHKENGESQAQPKAEVPTYECITPQQKAQILSELTRTHVTSEQISKMCKVNTLDDVPAALFEKVMKKLKATPTYGA